MPRPWPLLTALAAFGLYLATMAHVHHGDTPVYVEQILAGEYLARPHMLPRPLGALAVAIGAILAPSSGPYPPLIVLDAAAGAACVGLLHALVRRSLQEGGGRDAHRYEENPGNAENGVRSAPARDATDADRSAPARDATDADRSAHARDATDADRSAFRSGGRPAHRLSVELEVLAALAAAGFAVTRVIWGIATTFELALFPLVFLLLAAPIAATARDDRPVLAAVGIGALQAVAFGFHAIAIAALPAFAVALGAEKRDRPDRTVVIGALLAATAVFVVLLYQALLSVFLPANAPTPNALATLAQFAEPTLDAQQGKIQPADLALVGFGEALCAAPWSRWLGIAWVGLLVAGSGLQARALWERHRGMALFPAVWLLGVAFMAIKVEAGNYEYYAQAMAACFLWSALVLAPRPRVGTAVLGLFAAILGGTNLRIALENHQSEDGAHVERRFQGSEGARNPAQDGEDGPVHPPPGREDGPVNPPPRMRPGGR